MLWARKVRKDSELEDEVRFAIPGPRALSELIQSFKLYEPNSKDVVQGRFHELYECMSMSCRETGEMDVAKTEMEGNF